MTEFLAFGSLGLRDPTGRPLERVLAQPKRTALLAYLAFARPRGFHRRDELLAVFWPEAEAGSARNALSRSLSFLRRELPEGLIVTRGVEEIGLDQAAVQSDVVAFEEAIARGNHREAVASYRGPFLNALHVAGAPEFERWAANERERLREQASQSAWAAAHDDINAGRFVEAERLGQRALAWSPTDESAVQDFIAALAPGDRAAALRFYDKFAAVLAEELEVAPAPETVALAESIRARDGAAPRPDAALAAAGQAEQVVAPRGPDASGATSEPDPPSVDGPNRTGRWRRTVSWVAAITVIAGLAFAAWGHQRDGTGGAGTLIGDGRVPRYAPVVVAALESPFDPTLGKMAAEWLRAEIDLSDIMRPVSDAAIGAALRRMGQEPSLVVDRETAREIAIRDGYPLLVSGVIAEAGERYFVTVRLESPDGEVFGRFHESVGADADFAAALDGLGGEIRARIGESRRSIRQSPPLAQVTTGSLDALRLYTEAVALLDREGRQADAIPLLERAIDMDSGFAVAYRKLRVTLNNLGLQPKRQAELYRLAYEHRDRLTPFERFQVETSFAGAPPPDSADECQFQAGGYRRYQAYVRAHPEDPRPLPMYAYDAAGMGRERQAIEILQRAIVMGNRSNVVYNNLAYGYARLGDLDSAVATVEAWEQQLPGSLFIKEVRSYLLYATGQYDAADSMYDARAATGDAVAALQQAQIDLLRGRVREALAHYRESVKLLNASGQPPSERMAAWLSVFRLATSGDTVGVEARWTRDAPDPVNYGIAVWYDVGLYFAATGHPDRARQALDTLTVLGAGDDWLVRGLLRASIAAAAGETGSLEALESAESGCHWANRDYRFYPLMRGRVFEAMDRPGEAIAAYEAWLAGPRMVRWDAVFYFDTLERLGRLHEKLGKRAEAARYYTRAADLWRDADPEIQPRLRLLRAGAAALTGEG